MNKSEMAQQLNHKMSGLLVKDVELAVKCILRHMEESLVNGERIEIRGFGSFELRHRLPRRARNPRTGETVLTKARAKVHFKSGKELKERLNSEGSKSGNLAKPSSLGRSIIELT